MNTLVDCPDTLQIALHCARGDYQRSLILGRARWSGADLRGKASQYGAQYKRSRTTLRSRLRAAGLLVREVRGEHNLRVVHLVDPRSATGGVP